VPIRRNEDHFSRLARQKGFPARSVFKLQEMQDRFRLFRSGARILDLGSAPGSWSQFCLQALDGRGLVVGVDLNEPSFRPPAGPAAGSPTATSPAAEYRFIRGDLLSPEVEARLAEWGPYDLVLSDAAPQTSGSHVVDTQASLEIAARAVQLALLLLKPGGSAAVKVFQGGEEGVLLQKLRAGFQRARAFKPGASRSESREVYLLGLGRLAAAKGPSAADRAGPSGPSAADPPREAGQP
jgi:23S rRNA (uridine2552-2'-O)-methyltransferase